MNGHWQLSYGILSKKIFFYFQDSAHFANWPRIDISSLCIRFSNFANAMNVLSIGRPKRLTLFGIEFPRLAYIVCNAMRYYLSFKIFRVSYCKWHLQQCHFRLPVLHIFLHLSFSFVMCPGRLMQSTGIRQIFLNFRISICLLFAKGKLGNITIVICFCRDDFQVHSSFVAFAAFPEIQLHWKKFFFLQRKKGISSISVE